MPKSSASSPPVDALAARTGRVLSAPTAELARIVEGLLGLIRDQLVPDDHDGGE